MAKVTTVSGHDDATNTVQPSKSGTTLRFNGGGWDPVARNFICPHNKNCIKNCTLLQPLSKFKKAPIAKNEQPVLEVSAEWFSRMYTIESYSFRIITKVKLLIT